MFRREWTEEEQAEIDRQYAELKPKEREYFQPAKIDGEIVLLRLDRIKDDTVKTKKQQYSAYVKGIVGGRRK